eukprot:gnl/TRDRNA2_/TRDRNA2_129969_c0_seq2.p1 gnl/TRDRNA2_/TRDRNA2_129969_c0~~gnl/TRDRNA2_/TRDRNA2_129969_c0_seq2.p1  ORF type:complete len:977 (-),score=204.78 gnl/TRDRNA2_/TRDRNA2_129969_c0_seq2:114-2996(-)
MEAAEPASMPMPSFSKKSNKISRPPPPPIPSGAGGYAEEAPAPAAPEPPPGLVPPPGLPEQEDHPPPPGLDGPAMEGEEEAEEELEEVECETVRRKKIFTMHLDDEEVDRGLRSGRLLRGMLRVSNTRPSVAFVKPEGAKQGEKDLVVKGREARNRAVHGDLVIVELNDENPGDSGSDNDEVEVEQAGAMDAGSSSDSDEEVVFGGSIIDVGNEGKTALSRFRRRGGRNMPTYAKVVSIASPNGRNRVIVCTLHPNHVAAPDTEEDVDSRGRGKDQVLKTDKFVKAKPVDKRMPWVLIQVNEVTRRILKLPGRLNKYELWPINILFWKETSSLPLGRLKGEKIGMAGDLEAEVRATLLEHELDDHDVDFEDASLDEVDAIVEKTMNKENFEKEVAKRLDLRHKRVFTIDPATAKDLDDAIHVDLDDERNQVEVGVHIADVGHFLKLASITDTEAQRRTTSVYLIDRVLPMLPHALCNHLCSLNPNEPKLAFSAFFRLDRETGDLIEEGPYKPWFKKTVISSVCRLNYEEAQQVIDGEEIRPNPTCYGNHRWSQIKNDIFLLYEICGKVREGRFEGGALSITKSKMIFHTRESEDGIPTGYHMESHSASHWVIEELMLLANRCVAKFLAFSGHAAASVLRNHKPPDKDKAEKLEKTLKGNLGLHWEGRDAGAIFRSCQDIYRKYGRRLGLCIEMMTMRGGMKQAEYFLVDGEESPHHFALNFDYYTHFTSPIRRYPDVMVHRVLNKVINPNEDVEEDGFQEGDQAKTQLETCNDKKSKSRKCNDDLDRAVFCVYLRSRKTWFYTVGTVLGFQEDTNEGGGGVVTMFCSDLGKEKKMRLCSANGPNKTELFSEGIDDVLLLPDTWHFHGKGACEIEWKDPSDPARARRTQNLRVLSCVPIVIIPTDTVPIDFAIFFVSPFHKRYDGVRSEIEPEAEAGFEWSELEEDGVEVVHNAKERSEEH